MPRIFGSFITQGSKLKVCEQKNDESLYGREAYWIPWSYCNGIAEGDPSFHFSVGSKTFYFLASSTFLLLWKLIFLTTLQASNRQTNWKEKTTNMKDFNLP
jgi:hypothetical protein